MVDAIGGAGDGARFVTFDIGSRSTQMATGHGDGVSSVTVPIGSTTITADYLLSDPPDPGELSAALSVVELYLDDVVRQRPELVAAISDSTIVGMGAIRFVAEVELGVAEGDQIDGYIALKMEEVETYEHTPHPVEYGMYYSC